MNQVFRILTYYRQPCVHTYLKSQPSSPRRTSECGLEQLCYPQWFLKDDFFWKVTKLGTKLATLVQHLWHRLKKVNNLWDSDFLVIIRFRNSIIWCKVLGAKNFENRRAINALGITLPCELKTIFDNLQTSLRTCETYFWPQSNFRDLFWFSYSIIL